MVFVCDLLENTHKVCFLLLGANGAGKSTLLTILAGKRMVRDKVFVFGKDAFNDSPPVSSVTFAYTGYETTLAALDSISLSYSHILIKFPSTYQVTRA